MKLVQKSLFGYKKYVLTDEAVEVTIKSGFKEKTNTVMLVILNPEPVTENGKLHFHSRVKCGPLISLDINKPDEKQFKDFVEAVKSGASSQFSDFSGMSCQGPD
jgi:hypothetical protein